MTTLHSLFLVMTLLLSSLSFAAYNQAPPNFPHRGYEAVFVDFKDATYDITYDVENQVASVETTINFYSGSKGYPIFDLIPAPTSVSLNGTFTRSEVIQDPDKETSLRIVKLRIPAGNHQLKIKHDLKENVVFRQEGVASGFWIADLTDRKFLEQYLPANLEYDQFPISFKVRVLGTQGLPHTIKANGEVTELGLNEFEISFPSYFTSSSLFFHIFPKKNAARNVQFYFRSIDGRLLPVDIYTTYDTQEFVSTTKAVLTELEADYGPFPHPQVIIYGNALSGGMEYAGATATSLKALGHELMHSYHAKALMPANGNAGWMDEAMARLRDNKYPLSAAVTFPFTHLAGRSVWARKTDRMAYTEGSAFLSWISYRMSEKGLSFKKFLRDYFEKYKYTTVTTELFKDELIEASGLDLNADFDRYIYGKGHKAPVETSNQIHPENPYHPAHTKEQLLDLTWI